jgi:polyisoprenoid-binding protein YceI
MTAVPRAVRIRTGRWVVNPERSRATISVRNFGVRTVCGSVPLLAGTIAVDDEGRPIRVHAELDLAGIDTGSARRDADLRKPSLLDLDRHPTLTYDADAFELGPQGWVAQGTLAARGAACPLPVLGVPTEAGDGLHVVGTTLVDPTALGLRAPRLFIGRQVAVVVDAWLTRA